MLARVSQLGEDTCTVGAVGGHLALLVVGEPGQGCGEVEGRLRQEHLEQEAHVTQTQGQDRQRAPRRDDWEDVRVPVPAGAYWGPPLSPLAAQ